MKRFTPIITVVFGLILASYCMGQCSSSTRSYRAVPSYPKQPRMAVSVPRILQPSTIVQSNNIQSRPTQAQKAVVASQRIKTSKIRALRADEIKTIENGDRITVAMKTGKWPKGMAILSVNGMTMLLEPEQWGPESVTVRIPRFLFENTTPVKLFIAANPETLLEKLEFEIKP